MHISVSHFALRSPSANEAELVMTGRGKTIIYQLSFDQLRLLTFQSAEALSKWPVQPIEETAA